jgi:hypothetical protein
LTPYQDALQDDMDYLCAFVALQARGEKPDWRPPLRGLEP